MRRLTAALAVVSMLASQAQATTFFYFRGGAQAGNQVGTAPASPAAPGDFAILVDGPSPDVAIRGTPYSATTFAYSNVGPVIFAVRSGSLPSGLSINATTGTISGTPTADGSYSFVIQGVDTATNQVATQSLSVDAVDPFSITATPSAFALTGSPYSATFTLAGGSQPYGFSMSGTPAGLSLSTGATSATLTGIPTVAGPYNIQVTGSEAHGLAVTYPYTLNVTMPLTISGAPPRA